MQNLTPKFKKYVFFIEEEFKDQIDKKLNEKETNKKIKFNINDNFNCETKEFYSFLIYLKKIITDLRDEYLAFSDEPNSQLKSKLILGIDQDEFDHEFSFGIQKMYEKLKFLQSYEIKRKSIIQQKTDKWINSLFNNKSSEKKIFLETINIHRTSVLKYLNNSLNSIRKEFETIKNKRQNRTKNLNQTNFYIDHIDSLYNEVMKKEKVQVSKNEISDFNYNINDNDSTQFTYKNTIVSQQQINDLETENKNLLKDKLNQVNQVKQLHNSMNEIIKLQNEISFQLDSQESKLFDLKKSHDEIETNVSQGNIFLRKSKSKNKRSANFIIFLSIFMGFLLLIIDYLSF